jgi:hypothetical protein
VDARRRHVRCPAKRNSKRGAFGSPQSAARQKIYAISSTSSMANALTVYFEDEPGRRARGQACSPATRPGASQPTSAKLPELAWSVTCYDRRVCVS